MTNVATRKRDRLRSGAVLRVQPEAGGADGARKPNGVRPERSEAKDMDAEGLLQPACHPIHARTGCYAAGAVSR